MTTHDALNTPLVDLEIRLFEKSEQGYPIEITLGGQQEFPRAFIPHNIIPWVSTGDPAADGQKLFDALLADSVVLGAWAEARGQAPRRRIRLRIDRTAAELHTLPWELLQEGQTMLSAQGDTPFSRYLPIALPWSGPVDQRPIRALIAIANPDDLQAKHDLAPVDVAAERENLEAALADVDAGQLQVDFLPAPVTAERLEEALRAGYHIVHFVGHGAFNERRQQAALYMEDSAGRTQRMLDDELIAMLARLSEKPRLVFLVACQSAVRSTADAFVGLGPKLVSVGVPAVAAMQDLVTVDTARKFSSAFYKRLLAHGLVDLAVNEARSTLLTIGRADAATPVLFMRLKSGQLWGAEADARGVVLGSSQPRVFWSGMIKNIQRGKCVPIIGPRVHGRWLPTQSEIAASWAAEHDYPFANKRDFAGVAQYLASSQGEDFPRYELLEKLTGAFAARLPEELRPPGSYDTLTRMTERVNWQELLADDPNEVHQVLAALNLPLYLTTNFDNFMTQALLARGRQAAREICPWNDQLDGLSSLFEDDPGYEPTPEAPLVYHLFGCDQQVDSLALTTDSHLDFLVRISAERERIPNYIWAALTNGSLLFLGYSLYDWEFRVIMRGLVATRQQRRSIKHVAVQLELGEAGEADTADVQTFLQNYFQDAEINVFWGSQEQFVAELREQWKAAN